MTCKIQKRVGMVALATVLLFSAWSAVAVAKRPSNPTGTFSSMFYNDESTDLNGIEVRIVYTRKGFQGTVQISEGEPSELILIKPTIDDDNHITFEFTESTFGDRYRYSGRITDAGLVGRFLGASVDHTLKRAHSYWDARRNSPP